MLATARSRWICAALVVLSPLFYEYAILEFELEGWYAPSDALNTLARWIKNGWEWLGWLCAKLSSFLTWIRLERFLKAIYNLGEPVFQMCISPYYFLKGYIEAARLYDHPWKIRFGSAILFGLIGYLVHWWWKRRKRGGSSPPPSPPEEESEESEEENSEANDTTR
jgi:hypothetical protein